MKAICADTELFAVLRFDLLSDSTLVVVDSVELLRAPGMSRFIPMRDSHWVRLMKGVHHETWGDHTIFDFIPNPKPSTLTEVPSPPHGYKLRLSGAFWVTTEEALAIRRTPDIFQFDPTCKTSKHNIPLAFAAGVDGNEGTVLWGTFLLGAGETREMFTWAVNTIATAYGRSVVSRVRRMLSDGDAVLCELIDQAQAGPVSLFGGRRGRCFWHLWWQGFLKRIAGASQSEKEEVYQPVRITIGDIARFAECDAELNDGFQVCTRSTAH